MSTLWITMNILELFENSQPKLAGATRGIKIMSPEDFVSKSMDDESSENIAETDINEVSKDWRERSDAEDKIGELYVNRGKWSKDPLALINELKRLVNITGRAMTVYGGREYQKLGTAGKLLDKVIYEYKLNQMRSGQMPQFTTAAGSAYDMARQIAMQTNGDTRQKYARVWTTGYGQRYKDPSDFIEYKTEEDYDSAWDWVQSKGKKVYYYDHFKHLNTAIKIGKYIIEPASFTRGVFSGNPETTHQLSVRTAAVINQAVRRQADISDQQAMALKDIASTKNANAIEGLKLLMNVLKGEEDIKSVINNSKKLDPRDKAKLDQIIAGAKDFKEPNQGVAEGASENVWNAGISDEDFIKKFGKSEFDRLTKKYGVSSIPVPDLMGYRTKEPTDPRTRLHRGLDGPGAKLKSIIKQQGVAEATTLAAPTRPIGDTELTDYLDRIRNREKNKTDKYKLPYIHRSSVVSYYNEAGKKYNVDAIKDALSERPKKLLKQNEKMKHSNGELEQFFNIGFAALVGIALDENTNELIVVNTCPGAGSCKVDCFAMKGGKVQFQGPWLSDGRILTYLLNDPDGFFKQLDNEIKKEETKGDKGGYSVSIRWHDAGDFFSPEYVNLAFKLARNNPDISFYAYTKVSDVAMGDKPGNFMINWSEGAASREEKKIKSSDPALAQTKNSRIVPSDLFYDLLVKDEKKNLVKGPEGQWQVIPNKLPELKNRLAQAYKLSPSSILSYTEWENKVKGRDNTPLKYNVIITPGEPDLTAKDPGVLSTLLLKH